MRTGSTDYKLSCIVLNTVGLKSKGLQLVLLSSPYFCFFLAALRGIAGMSWPLLVFSWSCCFSSKAFQQATHRAAPCRPTRSAPSPPRESFLHQGGSGSSKCLL